MRVGELIKKLEEVPNKNLVVRAHEESLVLGTYTIIEIKKEKEDDKRGRK